MKLFSISLFIFINVNIALLGSGVALGQTSYGFRIGANVSTLSGEGFALGSPSPATGLVAGSFTRYALRSGMGIQLEVLYSTKGARFEDSELIGRDVDVQVVYLETPVLFTYAPPLSTNLRPLLTVGPALGFELSERIVQASDGLSQSERSESLASPDLGVAFGGEVQFELSGLDGSLGARYTLGLRNLAENETNAALRASNRSLSFTVGFLF